MDDPIDQFERWWREARTDSPLRQKNAICLSTLDERGFPGGRFVDLKAVDREGFVFCTRLDSAKGQHLQYNNKASITVWWDHLGYQVRVLGHAEQLRNAEADQFWEHRDRCARLTTVAFAQSEALADEAELIDRLQQCDTQWAGRRIPRPEYWSGYRVKPISVEFLTFRESRLHLRERYEIQDDAWRKILLQP